MTRDDVIVVDNLCKNYYCSSRERILWNALLGNEGTIFRALDGISISVKEGDILGVMGLNGAGKSTLLKILAGVSYPTKGKIWLRGTTRSILEVGTGFSQHLTGLENIKRYLLLCGLSTREIRNKENDIIDFSELSEVIEHPVRTYSTGMAARLIFSIVSSIPADILLIDELLMVGDEYYQGKCIRRMQNLCNCCRAVVIATHSYSMMDRLCTRGILLEKGSIIFSGGAHETGMAYARGGKDPEAPGGIAIADVANEKIADLERVEVEMHDKKMTVNCLVERHKKCNNLFLQAQIYDHRLGLHSLLFWSFVPSGTGKLKVSAVIDRPPGLIGGQISVVLRTGGGLSDNDAITISCLTASSGNNLYFGDVSRIAPRYYISPNLDWTECLSEQ